MIKKIKEFFRALKFAVNYKNHSQFLDVFDGIGKFVKEVHESGQPRMTHIVLQHMNGTSVEERNFVSIWAAAGGDSHPIKRLEQVIEQKMLMKKFLQELIENQDILQEEKESIARILSKID